MEFKLKTERRGATLEEIFGVKEYDARPEPILGLIGYNEVGFFQGDFTDFPLEQRDRESTSLPNSDEILKEEYHKRKRANGERALRLAWGEVRAGCTFTIPRLAARDWLDRIVEGDTEISLLLGKQRKTLPYWQKHRTYACIVVLENGKKAWVQMWGGETLLHSKEIAPTQIQRVWDQKAVDYIKQKTEEWCDIRRLMVDVYPVLKERKRGIEE